MGNENLLKTLFSRFGQLKSVSIVNECGIIEYCEKSQAQKAMQQMNGFEIGQNKLTISYGTQQISHILSMEQQQSKKTEEEEEDEDDDENTQELIDGFEQIEAPKEMKHRDSVLETDNNQQQKQQQNPSKMEENEHQRNTPNENEI